MKVILPEKLKKGDEIRVIAPSCSASTLKKSIYKSSVKRLGKIGLTVSFAKHVFEKNALDSSSIKSRVDDLHGAFKDKKVKGISCVRGGYNVNTLFAYLDWDLLRKNPKPIWGFSDITALANAIYAKTGIVTYIGPNFSSFGVPEEFEYVFEYFEKCLMQNKPFQISPSKKYGERKVSFKKNPGLRVFQEGRAQGTIIGGHLSTLNLLQGTEYMPPLQNSILFIETDNFGGGNSPLEFERDLQSLLHLPASRGIKGIVIGRFQKESKMTKEKLAVILEKPELKSIPIITDADFGHTRPLFTFPIGGTARIMAKGKKAQIEILKH